MKPPPHRQKEATGTSGTDAIERFLRERWGLDAILRALRDRLERLGMPSARAKYLHTSNPEQGHVQKFTSSQMTRLLESEHLRIVD